MIVRKIKASELQRVQELASLAFEFPLTEDKASQQLLEEMTQNPQSRHEAHWQSQWAAFEDDDQTMMSSFAAIPYPIHFDGHTCGMVGIGGVSTFPPYRRRGGIRACFEAALPEMYESGAVFSYLYPFSTAYYRKFGYEMCCDYKRWKLLIGMVPSTPLRGTALLVEEGNRMLEEIQAVYRVWQESYNMMVVGGDFEFNWVKKANPFKDQLYTYVYKAADGQPKAYASFQKADDPDGRNLLCQRFLFTDPEGFHGLMNLFVSLAADHRYVTFDLPSSLDITPLLPEWSMGAGHSEIIPRGMVRVVNVKEALHLARTHGEGNLVLEIHDGFIPQNNGRFAVSFGAGSVREVSQTDAAPDATLPIQEFSRLIAGVYDISALPFLTDVMVHSSAEKLSGLFFQKPLCITEYF
ncbi:MAG: GNAT family N-acetyltransferase [Clostridiales bacterium]|nr:GNAT family N-acetyltransferase [Clostridiales bacterium]